ncbi:hypothetical protein GCM10028805_19440 [Spirosoma harenae]
MSLIRTKISVFSDAIQPGSAFEDLPDFWVDPMPFVPREKERVYIEGMMDPFKRPFSAFTEKQWHTVYALDYTVDSVAYGQDEEGYFVNLLLKGD